jgi:hypothetical protein
MQKPARLYHGSDVRVDVLRPHLAHDVERAAGRRHGVYATHDRDVALGFALGCVPDREHHPWAVWFEIDPVKVVYAFARPNLGGTGYLYTVSSKRFEQTGSHEWVHRGCVTPLSVEEIEVDDHPDLFRFATDDERARIAAVRDLVPRHSSGLAEGLHPPP